MCVPSSDGIAIVASGGMPRLTAWLRQNGQCSKCDILCVGAGFDGASSSFTSLAPATVQISVQPFGMFFAAATACEIDGASAASRIAKLAIQAVMQRMVRVVFMNGVTKNNGAGG